MDYSNRLAAERERLFAIELAECDESESWEVAFDERMLAEPPCFALWDDGQPENDNEREEAYRAGWLEALANITTADDLLEEHSFAEAERESLKLSIRKRYAAGETIGRADQLAIDKARGRHQLSGLMLEEFRLMPGCFAPHDAGQLKPGCDMKPEDEWLEDGERLIRAWKTRTHNWLNRGYIQPMPRTDDRPATIQDCIDSAPGFIREYINHHSKTAYRRQPRFALAGALSLVGVLCGRKVRDALDTRTNIYTVCIGMPSSGKDRSRKLNAEILAEAGATQLLGPDEATSDSGIGRMLKGHPSRLMQVDEIGRWLKSADAIKNTTLYKTVTMLQKLWSDVVSRHWEPLAYADPTRNYAIDQPHLCILGTTTPETFYESLGGASIDDGFLSRVNIFVGNDKAERCKPKIQRPPKTIIDYAREWNEFWPDGDLQSEHPQPEIIESNEEAEELYDEFARLCDKESALSPALASLWGRAYQKARQFGLIYALSWTSPCSGTPATIEGYAARWGINLAKALTLELCELAESRLSRSQFEKDCQEVLRVIRQSPDAKITKQGLCRAMRRLKARERDDCIAALIEQGRIGTAMDGKAQIYFCAEAHPDSFKEFQKARDEAKKK